MPLLKYIGFWLAYTLPTAVFMLCPIVMFLGRNKYQRSPPEGSVLATALHLFAFAARGRWSWNPVKLWNNFNTEDFWEGAKPSRVANKPKWMTFDDQWVDEVQRGLKACAVFTWYPIYCASRTFKARSIILIVLCRAVVQSINEQSDFTSCYNGRSWSTE